MSKTKRAMMIAISFAMALALALTGCQSGGGATTTAATTAATTEAATTTAATTEATTTTEAATTTTTPAEERFTPERINFWSFDVTFTKHIGPYIDARGDKAHYVNPVVIPWSEFQIALNAALMTGGKDAPDLIAVEVQGYLKYLNSDLTIPLSEVGITDKDVSEAGIYDYLVKSGMSNGVLKALPIQSTPGAWIYRPSIAKKYLGVDSPEQMHELIKDWDTMLATAYKIKEASGGKALLTPGFGDWYDAMCGGLTEPYLVDGKVNIDRKEIHDYFEYSRAMLQNDLSIGTFLWTPAWFEFAKGDGEIEVLGTLNAPWVLTGQIKDQIVDDSGKGILSYGDWAVCEPPFSFTSGGTFYMIPANSQRKQAAADLLRFFCLDASEAGLGQWLVGQGDMSSSSVVNERNSVSFSNPICGGQNTLAVYNKIAQRMTPPKKTEYDQWINVTLLWSACYDYSTNLELTWEGQVDAVTKQILDMLADQ